MDRELETFVDQALDGQVYRNGISFMPGFVRRIASMLRRS
jgi:hypothetical protein